MVAVFPLSIPIGSFRYHSDPNDYTIELDKSYDLQRKPKKATPHNHATIQQFKKRLY